MERYLSLEDRIRRAEEIYERRNNVNVGKTTTVNLLPKKKIGLLKKIVLQIIICIGIYFFIYWMQSKTDNISIDSVNYIKTTLSYDMDFSNWINLAKNHIATWIHLEEIKNENTHVEEISKDIPEETLPVEENKEAKEEKIIEQEEVQDTSSLSQMEQDAEYIKNNFSIIKPVTGTITSRFGSRNPTTPTVPKYHTGIDIAVNEGTVFVAAMDGVVEQVSSQGDYRKSCKNNKPRCNDSLCTL